MAYGGLAEFLEELEGCGQLARVAAEVDAALEIAEVTRRVARDGGPAILFERVRGQSLPLVTNLLGSEDRVRRALEIESLDAITTRIESLIAQHTPQNWFERLRSGADEAGANKFRARLVKAGASQQVVRLGRDVDLSALPLVTQWSEQREGALTGGVLVTQDRDGETRTATRCPLVALDPTRLGVLADAESALGRLWRDELQTRLPATVVLGGDPAAIIAASIDLPAGVDFYHLVGLMRGRGVDVVKCRTHGHEVPAEADLILEGYLDPPADSRPTTGGERTANPPPDFAGMFTVTAVTHRTHPLVPAVIDTGEHGEPSALLKVRERMLLPALKLVAPAIVDLHLPPLGGLHRYALVSLAKQYPHQARQVASALWGTAALRNIRFLVLLDADVDVRDVRGVLAEVGAKAMPQSDVFSYDGPTAERIGGGQGRLLARHIGIDATTKIAGERVAAVSGGRLTASREIMDLVTSRWEEYQIDRVAAGTP